MNKRLSRLLITIEVLVLTGVLVAGSLGGLGQLGSRLLSALTEREAAQETSTEAKKKADSAAENQKAEMEAVSEVKEEVSEAVAEVVPETETETETEVAAAVEKASYSEVKITFSDEVEKTIAQMTNNQLVGQLFLISPESLVGFTTVRLAGDSTYGCIMQRPVFGLMYSEANFTDKDQMMTMLSNTQEFSQTASGVSMMMGITETGGADGSVIADYMEADAVESASSLIASGADAVRTAAAQKATYLKEAGFSLVFSTNAEVNGDLETTTSMVTADIEGIQSVGLTDVVATFPWNNDKDSSESFADLMANELSVYQAAVDAGAKVIMVSNTTVPEISGDEPCSLSSGTVDVLRGNMGYEGVLMTAAMDDSRITDQYSSSDAAVEAIVAGMDLIYSPADFDSTYDAVLSAVEDGTITEVRLHNAVGRVLSLKLNG